MLTHEESVKIATYDLIKKEYDRLEIIKSITEPAEIHSVRVERDRNIEKILKDAVETINNQYFPYERC